MRNFLNLLFTIICLAATTFLFATEPTQNESESKNEKAEQKEFIRHHLKDTHDFIFFENKETHDYYGFHLPVILWDNGLKIFSSKKFHWGQEVAEVGGDHYKIYHGKIYKTDAAGTINYDANHHPINQKPLDFSITKNVVFILLACLLMGLIFVGMAKSYKKNALPKGIGRFLEPIILYIRDDIARPNIGEKHYKKYLPFLLTVFFFIWILNIFGLTPFGSNVTNTLTVTLSLALFTFVITQFTAKATYWKHIFWMPGVPVPMKVLLMPIELLGVFIKPFALMIRLYANITAGHIVMMSLIGLIFLFKNWIGGTLSFGLVFAISLIEVLVAALQAYIFTMLSALYFGFASEEHDDHH